ncbi:MAG: hypothetical protein ACLUAR_16540 [Pilosibacter sp.]
MLYMAFVTIANYSQAKLRDGLRAEIHAGDPADPDLPLLNVWGFVLGTAIAVCSIVFNRTIAGKSYIYPLIPFSWSEIKKRFLRGRLPHAEKPAMNRLKRMCLYAIGIPRNFLSTKGSRPADIPFCRTRISSTVNISDL